MEAEALGPWLGNLFYILGGVLVILKIVDSVRRKPNIDVDLGSISSRLTAAEEKLARKQEANACDAMHKSLERDLLEMRSRHAHHEEKLSRQVGALHERINDVFGELREIAGTLKTYMERQ
jgi:hypothetical protein